MLQPVESPFLLPQSLSGTHFMGSRVANYEGWLMSQVLLTSRLFGGSSVMDAFWFSSNTKICTFHACSHVLYPRCLSFPSRPPTRQPRPWHRPGICIFSQATCVSIQGDEQVPCSQPHPLGIFPSPGFQGHPCVWL